MIHPGCVQHGHSWTPWERKLCLVVDGVEQKVTEWPDGSFECKPEDCPKLREYRRQCEAMGCDAKQFAEKLEPAGGNEIVDTHAWDRALAELAELKKKG